MEVEGEPRDCESCNLNAMDWGLCKNIVDGDECGCQEFEVASIDPLLCGCCECHKHYHMRQDVVEFGPCQKKRNGKLCGCQSFLRSELGDEKVCICCDHRQNFHRRRLTTPALCSGTGSGGGLEEVDVFMPSEGNEGLKRTNDSQEQTGVTGDSIQTTLKRMKVEPESGVQPRTQDDDHEGVVLRATLDKTMPSRLMVNWKTLQDDPTYGFKERGLYYPRISKEKKTIGKWVMFCCSCGVERSINPSFNLSNHKTHMSSRVGGSESVHEKNLRAFRNKEIVSDKLAQEEKEKEEAILKRRTEWVQKYLEEGKFSVIALLLGLPCGCCYLSKYMFTHVNLGWALYLGCQFRTLMCSLSISNIWEVHIYHYIC